MSLTVAELAERIGARVEGDGGAVVSRCAGLDDADEQSVSFLANKKYVRSLKRTKAAAVVISPQNADRANGLVKLVAEDPYFAFREAVVALHGFRAHPAPGVSDLACVHPDAEIGAGCSIQPFAVVSAGAKLGANCVVYPHCSVGPDVVLGDDCVLYANVVIYDGCVLGDRVTIHAGTVIGEDGFGYATHQGVHHKIPQIGHVIIEDDVEIGALCAIDRGTVGPTVIGTGTKTSNLVAIGHGTQIGPHNLIVAQVGIAGSVKTGKYVAMGGQAGIVGHVTIGDGAQIAAKTGVVSNLAGGEKWGGYAAVPLEDAKKIAWDVMHLPDMVKEMAELKARLEKLEGDSQEP